MRMSFSGQRANDPSYGYPLSSLTSLVGTASGMAVTMEWTVLLPAPMLLQRAAKMRASRDWRFVGETRLALTVTRSPISSDRSRVRCAQSPRPFFSTC